MASDAPIAIVGLAGRFPGAPDLASFWDNLVAGRESLTRFSRDELLAAGVPAARVDDPAYVPVAPVLDAPGDFDAGFFGYTPLEAEVMDPQHRLLLELAWEASEDAGHVFRDEALRVGVFASSAMNTYLLNTVALERFDARYLPTLIGSDKDFAATRISHRLGLSGPSLSVQTACSSSLVAVHLACQSLASGEIDVALVAAASIRVPQRAGHLHAAGSVFSRDGYCRPFDAEATGTIFGSGGAAIVLRRLDDALDADDRIVATVLGTAVNNDGDSKAEFTAPSVASQAAVVEEALLDADASAADIAYVEAHGTGTYLGDPIEMAALSHAFRDLPAGIEPCLVGSLKGNIGHLDAAAGLASLIKVALSIQARRVPPSGNFRTPNPEIGFENIPFEVVASARPCFDVPSRSLAGVTSLGIGGTNAHAVLGPAPFRAASEPCDWQLLPFSARSEAAAARAQQNVLSALGKTGNDVPELADAAWTLQCGRRAFSHRRFTVARDFRDLTGAEEAAAPASRSGVDDGQVRQFAFMFPGQGAQFPGMGRGLYERFGAYRESVDRDLRTLHELSGVDHHALLFGEDASRLSRTCHAQPLLFVVELALARLLEQLGVVPSVLCGHSIGEYVAATVAGVFAPEDALALVLERGRLMQSLPPGAMLSVEAGEDRVRDRVGDALDIACVNAEGLVVLSGTHAAIDAASAAFEAEDLRVTRLRTSHAFHSRMTDPVLDEFRERVAGVTLNEPRRAILSNLNGGVLGNTATDPGYWARHLRGTVRFDRNLQTLLDADVATTLLEVGPGRTLAGLAMRHPRRGDRRVVATVGGANERTPDVRVLLDALGKLWLDGADLRWRALHDGPRRRVSLPGYAFERKPFWLAARRPSAPVPAPSDSLAPREVRVPCRWFVRGRVDRPRPRREAIAQRWLVLADDGGAVDPLLTSLAASGDAVTLLHGGTPSSDPRVESVRDATGRSGYDAVLQGLCGAAGGVPLQVVDAREVPVRPADVDPAALGPVIDAAAGRLLDAAALLDALDRAAPAWSAVTLALLVWGDDPVGRTVLEAVLSPLPVVARQESRRARVRLLGAARAGGARLDDGALVRSWVSELRSAAPGDEIRIDGLGRVGPALVEVDRAAFSVGDECERTATGRSGPEAGSGVPASGFRHGGVYLVTGGSGRVGRAILRHLSECRSARLLVPTRARLDDARVARLHREVESRGGELLLVQADITDAGAVRRVVEAGIARYGSLDGVIHAAGHVGEAGFALLSALDENCLKTQFDPKLSGLLALERAVGTRPLDLMICVSSIAPVASEAGGTRHGAHAAANRALEAVVDLRRKAGAEAWRAIAWDAWEGEEGDGATASGRPTLAENEALAALDWLAAAEGVGTLVVRAIDAAATPSAIGGGPHVPPATVPSADRPSDAERSDARPDAPEASSSDGVPTSPVDIVCALFRELTGDQGVGPDDDFFEIGGTSLIATEAIERLNSSLGLSLDLVDIIVAPTPRALGESIEGRLAEMDALQAPDVQTDPTRDPPGETRGTL